MVGATPLLNKKRISLPVRRLVHFGLSDGLLPTATTPLTKTAQQGLSMSDRPPIKMIDIAIDLQQEQGIFTEE